MKINKKLELQELIAFTVLFYLLPIILLSFGFLPFEGRHVVLLLMGLVLVAYTIQKGVKAPGLGLKKDNLRASLIVNMVLSIAVITLMYILYYFGILTSVNTSPSWFFVFYIFVSVPVQEYIFRSLMFYEIGIFTNNKYVLIVLSTIIYSFAHTMYHNWQVIGVTLFMGLVWGYVYHRWPNYWGVFLSHALIGAAAVFVGIV